MNDKIVLAFSGGLDTSYCVLDLVEQGYEVHTAFVDTGGVDEAGREYFGHGCTGMGNDQLRFDQTVRSLGDYRIHAPIRDLQSRVKAVRDYELQVMADAGIPVEASASRYSINENLLGVTISGSEIDEFRQPANDAWTMTSGRESWPSGSMTVRVGFEQGVAVSLDGSPMEGPAILKSLNSKLGAWGVGRHIYTGDVTIGLKGRIAFECPGIDGLLTAHQALEDTVNTRFQNQFRKNISDRWAELVYTGFFYEPHKQDLEAYLRSSQEVVTGEVVLFTEGGTVTAVSVDSPFVIQNPEAVYAQSADWTPEEAVGFIKLLGQSTTLAGKVRSRNG